MAGTSTETISGKTTGLIHLADGSPARKAKVRAIPVGYRPLEDSGRAVFNASTDDNGRYAMKDIPSGLYNVLGELDGQATYLDSVSLPDTSGDLAPLTLNEPGVVSGYVELEPGDPLRSVTVQVLGTVAYANVDADGFFTLPALAPGRYRAAVTTSLDGYTTSYSALDAVAGRHDTLPNALRPIFIGIPIVTGLKASFDTLAQAVRLSWSASDYANLKEYLIYRDPAGSGDPSGSSIARVRDTVYIDFPAANGEGGAESWEYRVAINDKFSVPGRTYGSVLIAAPPASLVSTVTTVRAGNAEQATVSVGDSLRLIASFANPTRSHALLRWFLDNDPVPLRRREHPGRQGADTLLFASPAVPGLYSVRVELSDDAGVEWKASFPIDIRLDPPRVAMTPETTVAAGTRIHLYASVRQEFGKLVKMEWDIGGTGRFTAASNNDTSFLAPDTAVILTCVFRATDDDGLSHQDSTLIRVYPWKELPRLPTKLILHATVPLDGKILVMGGAASGAFDFEPTPAVSQYDTRTGGWTAKAPMLRSRMQAAAGVVDGKVYVMGGSVVRSGIFRFYGSEELDNRIEVYDPALDQWTFKSRMPTVRKGHSISAVGGKLYVLGGYIPNETIYYPSLNIDVYDPASDTWDSFASAMPVWGPMTTIVHQGFIYAFATGPEQRGQFAKFDPATREWTKLGSRPNGSADKNAINYMYYGVAAVGGEIFVFGGTPVSPESIQYESGNVYRYDIGTGDWGTGVPMPFAAHNMGAVSIGHTLFLLGGTAASAPGFDHVSDRFISWSLH